MYTLTADYENHRFLVISCSDVVKIFSYDPKKDATDATGHIGACYRAAMWIIEKNAK